MFIRCCFAIIAMVDTIFSTSNQSSLKFLPAFGIVHHVILQHLDFYLDHATLFTAVCVCVCVCVCAYFFSLLVSTFGQFQSFCLVKFPMDLHLYDIVCHDIVCHDTTCHDSCHARMHDLIHDGRLQACPSCLLGLLYVCRVNVRSQVIIRYQVLRVSTFWWLYKRPSPFFLFLVFLKFLCQT